MILIGHEFDHLPSWLATKSRRQVNRLEWAATREGLSASGVVLTKIQAVHLLSLQKLGEFDRQMLTQPGVTICPALERGGISQAIAENNHLACSKRSGAMTRSGASKPQLPTRLQRFGELL